MNYKIVVNKNKRYDKRDFSNIELKEVVNSLHEKYLLEKRTLKAFLSLKKDLENKNIFIDIVDGIRTFDEQEKIIEDYPIEYGEEYVKKYVAPIGSSEHHTGLCFDVGLIIDGKLVSENDELLEKENLFEKVIEILPDHGLILRYPKDKEKVTGYGYEPWHYRYVGKNTARLIMSNRLTLEEYDNLYNKSGVILVNKPKGITSRDAVDRISNIFDTNKVGHNGTLDPLAEGLLVVTINKACKINELLICEDKEYIAEVKVGLETDTLDLEGKIEKISNKKIDKDILNNLFEKFPRRYLQKVPSYSAVKVNGKKLYEYARNDIKIELPEREVIIKELELLDYREDFFKFRCVVSKGTYIRSLIKDMGDFICIPCTMSSLIRTKQGKFLLSEALNLNDISINSKLINIGDALDIPIKEINDNDYKLVINGSKINNNYNIKDKVLFVKNCDFIAIYKTIDKQLFCYKMLK